MKGIPMPISSPNRAENFPPPLLRFSRTNTASRSRGRSRSSPMFYIRTKRSAAETAQEPSSPKVTCFGQVRTAKSNAKTTSGNRRRSWLFRRTTGNLSLGFRRQKGIFRRIFCNCGLFSKSSYCTEIDTTKNSISTYSDQKNNSLPQNPRLPQSETKTDSISVPTNALILTRCRSAPYRSSSLAGRIWGSPFRDAETATNAKPEGSKMPVESKTRVSHENTNEMRNSTSNCVDESKGITVDAIHPLLLTRCKSEPAKTGERLNPETSFWRQRRFGSTVEQSLLCSLHSSKY
ncbi:uncharacterized protein LOC127239649 [Andrographis paniculata]|uniref:uncharacterized protein LOC127239649 n=1 Tax=Andrographis paniculata TaxID=175694 RepID=UPI0021E8F881|nr:uncharacterized protein LOC127239649 [Andrographis paniculata]